MCWGMLQAERAEHMPGQDEVAGGCQSVDAGPPGPV